MVSVGRTGWRGELDYRRRLHNQLRHLEIDARRAWGYAFEKLQRPYVPEGATEWLASLYESIVERSDLKIEQLFRIERLGVLLDDAAILGKPLAFEDVTRRALVKSADLISRKLAHQVGEKIEASFLRGKAADWLRQNGADFVRGVSNEARKVLRTVLAEGVSQDIGITRIADLMRETLPLPEKWAGAVVKYESELLSKGVVKDEAARLSRIYSDRLRTARAHNVARTEVHRASRNAERLMVEGATERGLIDDEVYEREWIGIVGDGRICVDCYRAHGSRAPIKGSFPNGSETTEIHVNDRCGERLVRKDEPKPNTPPFVVPKSGGSLRPMTPAEAARANTIDS